MHISRASENLPCSSNFVHSLTQADNDTIEISMKVFPRISTGTEVSTMSNDFVSYPGKDVVQADSQHPFHTILLLVSLLTP